MAEEGAEPGRGNRLLRADALEAGRLKLQPPGYARAAVHQHTDSIVQVLILVITRPDGTTDIPLERLGVRHTPPHIHYHLQAIGHLDPCDPAVGVVAAGIR